MKSSLGKIFFFIFLTFLLQSGLSIAENGVKEDETAAYEDLFEGFVFYADKQKAALKSVKIKFSSTLDSHSLGKEIIKALIAGPSLSSLEPVWPKDVKINSFFIADDEKAYVDLNLSREMMGNMDTQSELLAIYSMVNSLTLNIPRIKMVKILIQGKDALTLAGHIDLEYYYKTNMLIVK